jgi:prepilin-type N-terminal cleavage/methylation domain-containing protein
MRVRSTGFTLVEVLIASVILFAAITIAADTYRTHLITTEKATATAKMLTPLPLIVGTIRNDLQQSPTESLEGRGELLGVRYDYRADTLQFAPPPRRFDPDRGEFRDYPPRYRLYGVKLNLSWQRRSRQFEYRELAWQPPSP